MYRTLFIALAVLGTSSSPLEAQFSDAPGSRGGMWVTIGGGGIKTVRTVREFETPDRVRISSGRVSARPRLVETEHEPPTMQLAPSFFLNPWAPNRLDVCRGKGSWGAQLLGATLGTVGGFAIGSAVAEATVPDHRWERALGIPLAGAEIGSLFGVGIACRAWEDITLPEHLSTSPIGESRLAFGHGHKF